MAIVTPPTIKIKAGDARTIKCRVRDQDGAIVNLTGFTCRLGIKKNHAAASLYIEKATTSAAQALIIDAANGIVEFYIVPADTETNPAPAYNFPYLCEAQATSPAGKPYTIYDGTVTILRQVVTTVP